MTLRQQLLDGPSDLLPLPEGEADRLVAQDFATVRESFRAALAGRLAARRPEEADFEKRVLNAACRLLGHPVIDRKAPVDLGRVRDRRTVAKAITELNGERFTLPPDLLTLSIRELLLPLPFHRTLEEAEVATIDDLLALDLAVLETAPAIGHRQLGAFLLHLFDFLFLVNTPLTGAPALSHLRTDRDLPAKLLLYPWFSMASLTAGRQLLDRGELLHTMMLDQSVGGIFQDPGLDFGQTLVQFTQSTDYGAGFAVGRVHCEICGRQRGRRSLCRHAAALVLAVMTRIDKTPWRLRPLPMLFANTPWQLAVDILFDLYGPNPPAEIQVHSQTDHWQLTAASTTDFRRVSWQLPERTMDECVALFGGRLPETGTPTPPPATAQLRNLFLNLTKLSAAAPDLPDTPTPAVSSERAASFWGWLAASLALSSPETRFRLAGPDENTLFSLIAQGSAPGNEIFALSLPRARTPDVLDGLARLGHCERVPELQSFTRASLDDATASLHIESCLRLDDGRIMPRRDLEPLRYGRYFHITGQGFVAVREQDEDHTLSNTPLEIATIKADLVPDFLAAHSEALDATENDIEPDLRQLTVRRMPERLNLSGCRLSEDWCYLSGHYGMGNRAISLAELLTARQQGRKYVASGNQWLKLEDSPLSWLHELQEDRIWHDENGNPGGVRLSRPELLMLSSLVGEVDSSAAPDAQADTFARLRDVAAWQDPRQLPLVPIHLRNYQRNGLAWLFHLYQYRMGGVLADDMGLGKTHQALALLQAVLAEKNGQGQFLVVCPATVIPHWEEKTHQFYPELDCHVYHGAGRDIKEAAGHSLLLTTYGIVRRDAQRLAKLNFDAIILDEIQHLKNKKTELYKAARCLNGRVVIGLTGTPLENTVGDLKAIYDLCLPGLLGSDPFFRKQYVLPIEEQNDTASRDTLARLIHPFLLRRVKDQVLTELPDVIEDIRTCELSDDQVTLYREMVEQRGRALLAQLHNSTAKTLPYMEVLAVINYLKQICDHPALVAGADTRRRYRSGKWDLFVELLDECLGSSMKVVIFSHYTRMLDIIEQYLDRTHIDYCGLRGNMSLAKRQEMIKRFNNDPECKVFCASLLAGGVGVDLTAAQAVIHYDRWWNAAREDQATARVHRMGQRHVVQTFKLITTGTLEEKIHSLIARKRDLAQHLVREDDAGMLKRLSRDELIELLQWSGTAPTPSFSTSTGG